MFKRKDKKYQEQLARLEQLEKEIELLRAEFIEYRHSRNMQEFEKLVQQEKEFKLKQRLKGC